MGVNLILSLQPNPDKRKLCRDNNLRKIIFQDTMAAAGEDKY